METFNNNHHYLVVRRQFRELCEGKEQKPTGLKPIDLDMEMKTSGHLFYVLIIT